MSLGFEAFIDLGLEMSDSPSPTGVDEKDGFVFASGGARDDLAF